MKQFELFDEKDKDVFEDFAKYVTSNTHCFSVRDSIHFTKENYEGVIENLLTPLMGAYPTKHFYCIKDNQIVMEFHLYHDDGRIIITNPMRSIDSRFKLLRVPKKYEGLV